MMGINEDDLQRDIDNLRRLLLGGEYRERLPGRGITIVHHRHPLIEVFQDALRETVDQIKAWHDEMVRLYGEQYPKMLEELASGAELQVED